MSIDFQEIQDQIQEEIDEAYANGLKAGQQWAVKEALASLKMRMDHPSLFITKDGVEYAYRSQAYWVKELERIDNRYRYLFAGLERIFSHYSNLHPETDAVCRALRNKFVEETLKPLLAIKTDVLQEIQ